MNIRKEIVSVLQKEVSTVTINDEKDFDRMLIELGVDSLDTMSFLLAVQEKFRLSDIPDEEFQHLVTINRIADYIKNHMDLKGD